MMVFLRRSIAARLVVACLLVEVLMLSLLLASNGRIMRDALSAQFETRLAEVRDLLGTSLAAPLVERDFGELQDVLNTVYRHHGLEYLVLVDRRGQTMASAGQPHSGPAIYDTEMPVTVAGQVYGTLRIGISTAFFDETRRSLLSSGISIAGGELLLSALILSAIVYRMTRRLRSVSRASEAVAQGNLDVRLGSPGGGDEIDRLTDSFDRMASALGLRMNELKDRQAELASSNADLEQFAYIAAHDLREPMRMVSCFVALIRRDYGDRLDGQGLKYLGFAEEGAVRMDRQVKELLEFSRIGQNDPAILPLAAAGIISKAINELQGAISENGAVIGVPPGLPMVLGDESELVKLFQNLIGNGIKFRAVDRPPVITITFRREASRWLFSIRDNGIGIAEDHFERIFKIFQRLHTRDKYYGTGIGLASCRRIVEHQGGRIRVESTLGEGSVFHFTLPGEG